MNALLEVAISMALVYTLLSILVSYITEAWQRWKKSRGVVLRSSLEKLLNDPFNKNFCELLYEHPLIRAQRKNDDHKPSYISSALFVTAFTDILRREAVRPHIYMTTDGATHVDEPAERDNHEDLRRGIQSLAYSPLKVQLLSILNESHEEKALMNRLALWYDEFQQEVTSRFKAKARIKTMIISLSVAVVMNVDSIALVDQLSRDKEMRALLVSAAEQWIEENPVLPAQRDSITAPQVVHDELEAIKERMDSLENYFGSFGLPIGWSKEECGKNLKPAEGFFGFIKQFFGIIHCKFSCSSFNEIVLAVSGWLMTAIALSFGAPFWFDLLNRFVSMRSGRPRPQPMNPTL